MSSSKSNADAAGGQLSIIASAADGIDEPNMYPPSFKEEEVGEEEKPKEPSFVPISSKSSIASELHFDVSDDDGSENDLDMMLGDSDNGYVNIEV